MTIPPADSITIGNDGMVSIIPSGAGAVEFQELGRIKLASSTGSELRKQADTLFHVPDDGVLPIDDNAKVITGSLEGSNVNMTTALVDMIETSRAWEAQAKLLKMAEDLDDGGAGVMSLPR